ncbi:MAG: hypothetical protein ACLR56_03495 [Oscillospiraceae bacterium]
MYLYDLQYLRVRKNGTGGAADGERAEKIAKEPKKFRFWCPVRRQR